MITPTVEEHYWRQLLAQTKRMEPALRHTLVVSPHPDDETLGAGGLIATLRSLGIEVTVVAVTDGENAYGCSPTLGPLRELEQTAALSLLGVDPGHIIRLRLPDSGVASCESLLVEHLLMIATDEMHLVAPWHGDFHPDHEACGRAAAIVAKTRQISLTSFLFWTWHRGTPQTLDSLDLVSIPLSEQQLRRKRSALLCHRSQLEHASGFPILPDYLLRSMERPFEVFVTR